MNTRTKGMLNRNRYEFFAKWGSFYFFVNASGDLFAGGDNSERQLGLGYKSQCESSPVLVAFFEKNTGRDIESIETGSSHTLFATTKGEIFAVGYNSEGQCSSGRRGNEEKVRKVLFKNGRVNMKIIQIESGHYSSYFLSYEGDAYSAGFNFFGELGLGDVTHRWKAEKVTFPTGEKIEKICAGYKFVTFLSKGGNKVYSAGSNDSSQLGLGHTERVSVPTEIKFPGLSVRIKGLACCRNAVYFLTTKKQVLLTGSNPLQLEVSDKNPGKKKLKVKRSVKKSKRGGQKWGLRERNVSTPLYVQNFGSLGTIESFVCGSSNIVIKTRDKRKRFGKFTMFGRVYSGHNAKTDGMEISVSGGVALTDVIVSSTAVYAIGEAGNGIYGMGENSKYQLLSPRTSSGRARAFSRKSNNQNTFELLDTSKVKPSWNWKWDSSGMEWKKERLEFLIGRCSLYDSVVCFGALELSANCVIY